MAFYVPPKPKGPSFFGRIIDNPVTKEIGNFATDVKNTAYGLPTGLLLSVEHPIRAAVGIKNSYWQMYSPLLHGEFGKFGHNLYDHPLAPLLDLATVFTLGAGSTVKAAVLMGGLREGAEGSRLARIAALGQGKEVNLTDKADLYKAAYGRDIFKGPGKPGAREVRTTHFSPRPGRRLMQEADWRIQNKLESNLLAQAAERGAQVKALSPHIPRWVSRVHSPQARFEKLTRSNIGGRDLAHGLWMNLLLMAGKALNNPETAPSAYREVLIGYHANLIRHATKTGEFDPLIRRHKKTNAVTGLNGEYVFIKDMTNKAAIANHAAAGVERAKWSVLANSLKGTVDQIEPLKKARAQHIHALVGQKIPLDTDALDKLNALDTQLAQARSFRPTFKAANRKVTNWAAEERKWNRIKNKDSYDELFKKAAKANPQMSPTEVFNSIARAQRFGVTDNPLEALRHEDGSYYTAHKRNISNQEKEFTASTQFLHTFWTQPHNVWKKLYLGYTLRTVTQNAVGNYSIYVARTGGVRSFLSLGQALVRLGRHREASQLAALAPKVFGTGKHSWIWEHFSDELGNTFGLEIGETKRLGRFKQGFYPLVQKYADEPVRLASIIEYLKSDPAVRNLMKTKSIGWEDAARELLPKSRSLRDRAANNARVISGDYATKGPIESVIASIVPFYLWDKHIVKSTGNITLDTPGRVAVATRIGNEGIDETQKILGKMPSFLQGVIPGSMIPFLRGKHGTRSGVAQTQTLNPFAQIGDLAALGESAITGGGPRPGSSISAQLSPAITGAMEFITGRDLLSGAQRKHKVGLGSGLFVDVGKNIGEGLPYFRLVDQFRKKDTNVTPKGKDLLYRHDKASILSSLLGLPERDLSTQRAADLYKEEQNFLHPEKKSSGNFFIPPL